MTTKTLHVSEIVVEYRYRIEWEEEPGEKRFRSSIVPTRIASGLPIEVYEKITDLVYQYYQGQDPDITKLVID